MSKGIHRGTLGTLVWTQALAIALLGSGCISLIPHMGVPESTPRNEKVYVWAGGRLFVDAVDAKPVDLFMGTGQLFIAPGKRKLSLKWKVILPHPILVNGINTNWRWSDVKHLVVEARGGQTILVCPGREGGETNATVWKPWSKTLDGAYEWTKLPKWPVPVVTICR